MRVVNVRVVPLDFSLISGDALNNLRASLDYLAWQLVAVGNDPNPKAPHRVIFPILSTESQWLSAVGDRLPGIRPEHRAIVQKHQPYIWKDKASEHPLTWLAELSRMDKHREIQLTHMRNIDFAPKVRQTIGFRIDRVEVCPASLIKVGAELARLFGERTGEAEPKVQMSFEGSYTIAFENGLRTNATLDKIGAYISAVLREVEPLL